MPAHNKVGAIVGTLSYEDLELLITEINDEETKRRLLRWLRAASKPLLVALPFEE